MTGDNKGNPLNYYNTSRAVRAAALACFGVAAFDLIGAYALDFSHGYLAVPFSIGLGTVASVTGIIAGCIKKIEERIDRLERAQTPSPKG